jgi:uncharacterized protein YggL (DUF469 family)
MSAACPVFGFVVVAVLADNTPGTDAEAMVDDLIETLEAHGLMMGGGGDRVLEYVVNREGSQATDADRQPVTAWAERWRHAAAITVSELIDLSQVV